MKLIRRFDSGNMIIKIMWTLWMSACRKTEKVREASQSSGSSFGRVLSGHKEFVTGTGMRSQRFRHGGRRV
jgi:hypothetical protein